MAEKYGQTQNQNLAIHDLYYDKVSPNYPCIDSCLVV